MFLEFSKPGHVLLQRVTWYSTCKLLLCDDFGVSYIVSEESQAIGVFEARCHSVQQRPHRFGHARRTADVQRLQKAWKTPGLPFNLWEVCWECRNSRTVAEEDKRTSFRVIKGVQLATFGMRTWEVITKVTENNRLIRSQNKTDGNNGKRNATRRNRKNKREAAAQQVSYIKL